MSVHDKEEAAIRTHLSASDAEREPVASDVQELVERLEKVAERRPVRSIDHAIRKIRELEAETTALKARLAEALKALEPFALVAEHDISEDEADSDAFRPMPKPFNHAPQITVGHLRAARRVREGSAHGGTHE